jgi:peroxiredoxin Q/BCP
MKNTLAIFAVFIVAASAAFAGPVLKVGDKAPSVSAPLSDGTTFVLEKWLDRAPLVLYFYPKDNTPGCTKEACSLRDDFPAFQGLKATVIGISYDTIASHKKFIEKYKLPFLLMSDTKKSVAKAFGVNGLLFAHRATFIVDKTGAIIYVNPSVDPKTHSAELKEFLGKK